MDRTERERRKRPMGGLKKTYHFKVVLGNFANQGIHIPLCTTKYRSSLNSCPELLLFTPSRRLSESPYKFHISVKTLGGV